MSLDYHFAQDSDINRNVVSYVDSSVCTAVKHHEKSSINLYSLGNKHSIAESDLRNSRKLKLQSLIDQGVICSITDATHALHLAESTIKAYLHELNMTLKG